MIVIAAAVLKEVDSQCLVACPNNGCTHDQDSGWVDAVHKHNTIARTQIQNVTFGEIAGFADEHLSSMDENSPRCHIQDILQEKKSTM